MKVVRRVRAYFGTQVATPVETHAVSVRTAFETNPGATEVMPPGGRVKIVTAAASVAIGWLELPGFFIIGF